jgi:hypothetical protein
MSSLLSHTSVITAGHLHDPELQLQLYESYHYIMMLCVYFVLVVAPDFFSRGADARV